VYSWGTSIRIALLFGWLDLKQAYRRSALGPFWLTIGVFVQIVTIGLVFGLIFETSLDDFLPFLSVSLILWGFVNSSILEGSGALILSEGMIRQLPIKSSIFILRSLWKNILMLAHNLIILPVVFLVFLKTLTWNLVLVVPGFILTTLFLLFITHSLGIVTTRFRDMQQIIPSIMTIMFYVTPVIWQPSLIPSGTAHLLLGLNPLYHFLQIMRLPLLGQAPTVENWSLALVMTVLAGIAAYIASKKYRHRLAYWV
jgi:ABC-type polysaccharide/polyol phosphate export permease